MIESKSIQKKKFNEWKQEYRDIFDKEIAEWKRKYDKKINRKYRSFIIKEQNKIRRPRSKKQRHKLFNRDKGICGICNKNVPFNNFHLDHIIPLSKSGTDNDNNIQLSHVSCNLIKGAKVKNKSAIISRN